MYNRNSTNYIGNNYYKDKDIIIVSFYAHAHCNNIKINHLEVDHAEWVHLSKAINTVEPESIVLKLLNTYKELHN